MKLLGKAKVLRIYLDENIKSGNRLLYRTIVEKLRTIKIAGATVFKAVEGFGFSARIHDAGLLEISENLPMVVEVVDTPAQIAKALKPILAPHCLVTV
jgi:PII-like signaling protein